MSLPLFSATRSQRQLPLRVLRHEADFPMRNPSAPALPADVAHPSGLLHTLLTMSLTAIAVLRPRYEAQTALIQDFDWVHLNPAGQRMLQQPACPSASLLTLFPTAKADGVFESAARRCGPARSSATKPITGPMASMATFCSWPSAMRACSLSTSPIPTSGPAQPPRTPCAPARPASRRRTASSSACSSRPRWPLPCTGPGLYHRAGQRHGVPALGPPPAGHPRQGPVRGPARS